MSDHPHFRSDPSAAAAFDGRVERDPASAVRFVLSRMLSVRREDVPTPHLDTLESMPREMRAEYSLAHGLELSKERSALQLVANQANMRRVMTEQEEQARQAERAHWITTRAAQIEAAYFADLRARFRAQAEAEAAERFGGAPASPPPSNDPPRPRKRAA